MGGASTAGVDPNRPSEPKRSSSDVCSTLMLLLEGSSFPAFSVPGSVRIRGRGFTLDIKECEAAGKSVETAWLDLFSEDKTKPDGSEIGTTAFSLAADVLAACCLAALDWGLRCAEILARVCRTEDSHQKSRQLKRKHNDTGMWTSPYGHSVVLWLGLEHQNSLLALSLSGPPQEGRQRSRRQRRV